jgi:DNA-binding transcriptional LysR family regulator
MDIDTRLIRHVLTLARHRNFARAADQLNLSQPALSRSIARLEDTLGVALFDRTREGVTPTDYGRIIIERGEELLRRGQELLRELDLMQGLEIGELTVVAGPFPNAISAGPALSRLLSVRAGLHIRLSQQSPRGAVAQVLNGSADLGIADMREWEDDARVDLEPLPQHPGFWVARADHPLSGQCNLTLAEVLAYRMICCPLPRQLAELFENVQSAGHIDMESGQLYPAVCLDDLKLGPEIAAASDAVLLSPIGIVARGLESQELVILDLHLPWQRTAYGFVTRRGRTPSAATLEFMACVRALEAAAMDEERRLIARYVSA